MRPLFLLLTAVSVLTLSVIGCGDGFVADASFVRTSTVPLGQQTTFLVDSPVSVTVIGQPRSTDLVYNFTGTVTASTASVAQALADGITLETEDVDARATRLLIDGAGFGNGRISGTLRIWLPDDMAVSVVARDGTLDIVDVGGDIEGLAAFGAKILGAQGSVSLGVDQGNAIAEVAALPGSTVELATNTGDVQVLLPGVPSVTMRAQTSQGAIVVRHPRFPANVAGGLSYAVAVNGGLSQVTLTAGIGNVVIDPQ